MTILFRVLALLWVAVVVWLALTAPAPLSPTLLVTASGVSGALAAVFWLTPALRALKTQKKQSARVAEKMEVSAENSGEKVRALEAKIKTLEKALDEALSR